MFPPFDSHKKFAVGAHNKQIHCSETRAMMVRVILALVKDDTAQLGVLLSELNLLVPVYDDEGKVIVSSVYNSLEADLTRMALRL
jgi:hypothetical protein